MWRDFDDGNTAAHCPVIRERYIASPLHLQATLLLGTLLVHGRYSGGLPTTHFRSRCDKANE